MTHAASRPRRGFLLLEMVLALGVFSMAAVGFVVALHRMSVLATSAQREMQVTRILDSALDETLSLPVLEEGETEVEIEDPNDSSSSIKIVTTVELLEEMENEDGQLLQEMYHIIVRARWMENREAREREVDTWRYGRMYQP
jgi:hypothetical protein